MGGAREAGVLCCYGSRVGEDQDGGGEGAILELEESIGGMLKVLRGVRPEHTGKFYTYSGEEVPW